nr:hypothetical protein [Tanacetum cinerariifolium]
MEKFMSERIDTEGRIKEKFKEQDRYFLGLEFGEYMCRMLQNGQKSEGSFLLPLGSQVREPPVEPSGRHVPAPYPDDPYVVTRDAAIADAAIATFGIDDDDDDTTPMDSQPHKPRFVLPYPDDPYVVTKDAAIADATIATFGIDDDDDDTAPMDSQPHEPRGSPRFVLMIVMACVITMPPRKSTRGNPPPPLTQDTVNRMIQESVKAAIQAERERVQNEANRAEGPNVAPVARECTFADFMKCSPITFRGNEGAVGLIRWIEKTEIVFT